MKNREIEIEKLRKNEFDILIIGGGATGTGAALDATLRGLKVALIEKNDFSSGTSSKSTKLIHGGVRYLPQFEFKLIHHALSERKKLLKNAPHLVKPLKFILPTYKYYEKPFYSLGLTIYDVLATVDGLPNHKMLSSSEVSSELKSIENTNLKGGISYYDAQFNDSRLNILLAVAAKKENAFILSRVELKKFNKDNDGKIISSVIMDSITKKEFKIRSKVVINSTGIWSDEIRKMDDPNCKNIIAHSQGIHLVFSKEKIPFTTAMIIPKTSDGRVVFIIPWEDYVVMGTTDTPITKIDSNPLPTDGEIEFLLETGNRYLKNKISRKDILSVYVGIRPLISNQSSSQTETKNLSREETILTSPSGLVTIAGGKWSTYRKMGEEVINEVVSSFQLEAKSNCLTHNYPLPGKEGFHESLYSLVADKYKINENSAKRISNFYGGHCLEVLGENPRRIFNNLDYFYEEVDHFILQEFALTTFDIIARRFRIVFLDLTIAETFVEKISIYLKEKCNWSEDFFETNKKESLELINHLKKSIQN